MTFKVLISKIKKSFNLKSLRRYILCTINNSHTILQDSMVCMIRKCWNIHFMEPSMTRLNCKKHDKLFKYLHAMQFQLFVYSAISRYTLCHLHLATEIAHILIVFSILSLPLSRQNHVSYHRCSLCTSWEAQAHELHFCGRRNSTDSSFHIPQKRSPAGPSIHKDCRTCGWDWGCVQGLGLLPGT